MAYLTIHNACSMQITVQIIQKVSRLSKPLKEEISCNQARQQKCNYRTKQSIHAQGFWKPRHVTIVMQIALIKGSVSLCHFSFWLNWKENVLAIQFYNLRSAIFKDMWFSLIARDHIFRLLFNIWWLNSQTRFNRSWRLASCLIYH